MSLGNTGEGFNWTNAYLSSAMPWVTGSVATSLSDATKFSFPKVTKYVKVLAQGDHRVGFTPNGITGSNFFTVLSGTTVEFNVRVSEIYVLAMGVVGTVDIFAGLTLIDKTATSVLTSSTDEFSELPGSGWLGVG